MNASDRSRSQSGTARTDARHRVTISGVWAPGYGLTSRPIVPLPVETPFNIITGIDDNRDGLNFDLPAGPRPSTPAVERTSRSSTSGSRRGSFSAAVRGFELIAEGFNLTNASNPGSYVASMTSPTFGTPTQFAGDFQRGEQRLFQFGARFEF